jgi:polysaccharide export outer membrane protein
VIHPAGPLARKLAVLACSSGVCLVSTAAAEGPDEAGSRSKAPSAPVTRDTAGAAIAPDSKLIPGDEVLISIDEDREPGSKMTITKSGEAELGILGSVKVIGKTPAEAASTIASYLKGRYYRAATVRVQILRKSAGPAVFYKVTVAGAVERPGRQFSPTLSGVTLSAAVTTTGPSIYSELRRVRLTRDGKTTEHDVERIITGGRKDLDVQLRDGDQIYVPKRPLVL